DRHGRVFWAEVTLRRADLGGRAVVVAGVRDVTERRRAEDRLRATEERFEGAFRHAAIGMALCGLDGRFLQVNRSLCELLGYAEAELLALTFGDVTHPGDRDASWESYRRLLAGEVSAYGLEKRYLTRSGEVVWTLITVSLSRDRSGRPLHSVSQVQDFTQRRRAEQALRASEQGSRLLVEAMSDGLAVRDEQWRFQYV
ncbi:MAG: PAS domain S-box protein, partial [Deferrisomatales bacterium]